MKALSLVVLISCSIFCSCKQEQAESGPRKSPSAKEIPAHTITGFSMLFTDSNRIRASLQSAYAIVYDQRNETVLDSAVMVEFMNAQSKRVGILTADSARIDDKTQDMFAYGNVIVRSDSTGTTLRTSVLMWKQQKQLLYTNERVNITTPSEIIDGTGMESDQWLKNYKIFKVSGIRHAAP
jgi:LPS export ABC transporter protein LptC